MELKIIYEDLLFIFVIVFSFFYDDISFIIFIAYLFLFETIVILLHFTNKKKRILFAKDILNLELREIIIFIKYFIYFMYPLKAKNYLRILYSVVTFSIIMIILYLFNPIHLIEILIISFNFLILRYIYLRLNPFDIKTIEKIDRIKNNTKKIKYLEELKVVNNILEKLQ